MLVIRDLQLSALRQEARRRFVDRAVARMTADHPDACRDLGEPGLRGLVEHAIDLGGRHGIVTEGGVLALLRLMIQYGAAFERSPDRAWAMGVLAHARLPGPVKVDMLCQRLAARARGRVVVEI